MVDEPKEDSEFEPAAEAEPYNEPPEPKRWQVVFEAANGGHGEQVLAASEADVRELMAKNYGEDYPIRSVTELK